MDERLAGLLSACSRFPSCVDATSLKNDKAGAPGVVLINQALAKQFWPNEDPVGQHIMCGQGYRTETGRT